LKIQPEASSTEEGFEQNNDQQLKEQLKIAEQKRLEAERKLAEEKRKQEERERLEAERKQQEAERQRQEELKKKSDTYRNTLISLFASLEKTFSDFKESCSKLVSLAESRKDRLTMIMKENQKMIRFFIDDSGWKSFLESLNKLCSIDIEISEAYIETNQAFINFLDTSINKFKAYTFFLSRSDEIISKDEFDKRIKDYKKWKETFDKHSKEILEIAEKQSNFLNENKE